MFLKCTETIKHFKLYHHPGFTSPWRFAIIPANLGRLEEITTSN
jgi:hypothetical protein